MQYRMQRLVMFFAGLLSAGTALAQVQTPHQCVQDAADDLVHLWQTHHVDLGYRNIYTHPCTGGLYLIDPRAPDDELHVLWQGWWLQGL